MISVPLMVTISELFVQPILDDTELKDLSLYTRIFNIIILGYIFRKSVISLVKSANIKLLYVPAVIALLWLEQYSLIIIYLDDNSAAFIGSIIVRLFGLALFVHAIHYAISSRKSRGLEVEMKPEKRHKLQLFYEILCAIGDDIVHNKVARPTHIQHNCRLSYDKMMNHVIELERRYLIYREKSNGLISLTSKGKKFVKQYNELIKLIESVGL